MLRKTYTADLIKDGVIRGSVFCDVFFFRSSSNAWDILKEYAIEYGAVIFNFRRVK